VVPITAWLGSGGPRADDVSPTTGAAPFTVLLITGPNTGGKTVALKTIGLLALMAQAGLCVPADADSRLPVFDAVYADIGDEQSIEQSLSTFSAHMTNIISILSAATGRSLVLLDELAAGTDPVEGAALAKAVLSHLLKTGALTVATTHHGQLKAFAHTTPGVTNASVEFDPEKLSPTYRLQIGLPGQSNALAIAERLGMPETVMDEARQGIGADRLAVESLIGDLHRHREEAASASESQRTAAEEAERARARVTKELQSLETNRNRLIEKTRRELEAEVQQARARIRDAMKALEKAERMTVFERAAEIQTARDKVMLAQEGVKRIQQRERTRRRKGSLPPVRAGDLVFLQDMEAPGEAITEPDSRGDLEISLGGLRARVNLRQIIDVQKPAAGSVKAPEQEHHTLPPPGLSPELDLRGMTVDEATSLVDQRLDEAVRGGVQEIRIIHGKGTGALRQAIRDMLRNHPLVSAHAPAEARAGGDGVTVATLAH
jgi:DNA mismatch repair protein MutS2